MKFFMRICIRTFDSKSYRKKYCINFRKCTGSMSENQLLSYSKNFTNIHIVIREILHLSANIYKENLCYLNCKKQVYAINCSPFQKKIIHFALIIVHFLGMCHLSSVDTHSNSTIAKKVLSR